MLYDRFYISSYMLKFIRKDAAQDRTGISAVCTYNRCLLGDFPLLQCVHLGISPVPHPPPPQGKRFLLVFCLHRTSEKGTLVQLEEEPSVFPRVWVMLLLGVTVIPDQNKTHLRECKLCKSDLDTATALSSCSPFLLSLLEDIMPSCFLPETV